METHARFFLIGIFSLAVTAGLIVFVLWLGKLQLDREYQEYDVRFHESVAGLSVGGIVQYQGVQVGEVRSLGLDPQDPREVSVRVRVSATTPVKTDTRAQLSYSGLTGVAVVELLGGSPEADLLRETDASPAPRIDTVPSSLSQLMSGGSGAMHSANEVLIRIGEMLNDENLGRVSKLLANLEAVSTSVNDDYPTLRAALVDVRVLEDRLGGVLRQADALLAQMRDGLGAPPGDPDGSAFHHARAAIADLRNAAKALEQFSAAGERTVSEVDDTARAELVATLRALQLASENLARITQRLDQAPADYLLGRDALPVYHPEPNPP